MIRRIARDTLRGMMRVFCFRAMCLSVCAALASAVHAADVPALPTEVTRIAFGSCLRQNRPAPILDTITAARPDVLIWLGDNIYGDSDDPAVIRAKYDELAARPEFQKLRAAVPFLATWDDHDMGKNDAGVEYAFKEQNKQIMLDFFGEPKDSARRTREGVYDSVILGPEGRRVQIILLDTRWFRSPMKVEMHGKVKHYVATDDPNATVLGDAQWAWLEQELKKPAELRVICSSIQLLAEGHRFEKWANFPKERQRLIDLLAPHAKSTIVLSGDRHHSSAHVDPTTGLLDITASSFNQPGTPSPEDYEAPNLTKGPFNDVRYGLIEIEWPATATPAGAPVVRWDLKGL